MSIKSILLHVDATSAAVGRLQVALRLAHRLDARLTAAFGASWDDRASFAYSAAAALEGESGHAAAHRAALDRLRRHPGVDAVAVAWCDIVGEAITPGFVAEAVYADLLIVGQQARVAEPGSPPPGFAESAILQSGRPALVVPAAFRHVDVARSALVAWNGSMPSVRALSGALPLLQAAEHVHVVSWTRHAPLAPFSRIDVGEYLARHGVRAEIHGQAPSANVGGALAAMARELSSDLIVMGCYGHSRATERVFGGTSRSILATTDVPVLMAH
ncbi:MAG TPA: universal stress protein [Caldimonas sp.]|jgi:nucleotide-binding universal stress UspA family protein|nr:universal stress protein [Caldimonas sp.]HEX2541662.1 universal stress protein [Caldimonas sp.]